MVDPDRVDKQTDLAHGLRVARAAVELAPRNSASRDTLAWALFANGFYDESVRSSKKAVELDWNGRDSIYQTSLERLSRMIEEDRAGDARTDD